MIDDLMWLNLNRRITCDDPEAFMARITMARTSSQVLPEREPP